MDSSIKEEGDVILMDYQPDMGEQFDSQPEEADIYEMSRIHTSGLGFKPTHLGQIKNQSRK